MLESVPSRKGTAYGTGYVQLRLLKVVPGCTPKIGSVRGFGVLEVIREPKPSYKGKGSCGEWHVVLADLIQEAETLSGK